MKDIDQLIHKYFEGQTSLEEEQILRDFFSGKDVPGSLKEYIPIFTFFTRERENRKPLQNPKKSFLFLKWTSISAAACIVLFLGIRILFAPSLSVEHSFVYINGKKYTDIQKIREETVSTLEIISAMDDEVLESQISILESFNE